MVNASSCPVELWTHLGDVLGGLLLSSQELEVSLLTSSLCSMGIYKIAKIVRAL